MKKGEDGRVKPGSATTGYTAARTNASADRSRRTRSPDRLDPLSTRERGAHLRDNILRSGKHTIKNRTADREAPGSCFRKPSYLRLGHNRTSRNHRSV